jgi:hypothetical protein
MLEFLLCQKGFGYAKGFRLCQKGFGYAKGFRLCQKVSAMPKEFRLCQRVSDMSKGFDNSKYYLYVKVSGFGFCQICFGGHL